MKYTVHEIAYFIHILLQEQIYSQQTCYNCTLPRN